MTPSSGTSRVLALTLALGLLALWSPAPALAADDPFALAAAGRYPEARDAAKALLAKEPANAGAARLLQDMLLAMGEDEAKHAEALAKSPEVIRKGLAARRKHGAAAVKAWTALQKAPVFPTKFMLDIVRAQLEAGKPAAAESAATRYLGIHAKDPDGLAMQGAALLARRRPSKAIEALESALTLQPGHALAATTLADLHAEAERDQDARRVLQEALGVHPKQPQLLFALVDDQIRHAEYDEALRGLGTLLDLPVRKADVHARMGEVHRAKKDLTAALRCAEAALALDKEHARALRVRGFVRFKQKDLVKALADYEAAAKLRPAWPVIHTDIALVHIMDDKWRDAERAAQRALDLDKHFLEAHLRMGQVYVIRGKTKEAKKSFGVVLKKNKNAKRANRYMGYVTLSEGKPKQALKHFRIVSEVDETDSSSVRMMGRCLLEMGKIEEAVESFRDAIARNSKDAFAFFDLGKGLEAQERWEDAAEAYAKATQLDAELVHPHLYLGELYDDVLDDRKKAIEHYKRYLELDGKDDGKAIEKRIKQLEEEEDQP